MGQLNVPFSGPSRSGATSISLCTPVDNDARHHFCKTLPSFYAGVPLPWKPLVPSWESVRHHILSLACLQLLHDASPRLWIEKEFGSDDLMLDFPKVLSSISILNTMDAADAIIKNAHDLLSDVLDDFSSLEGWRLEQISDHLAGYLHGENSLENVERLVRRVLLGSYHELTNLDRELDRIRDAMNARWLPTQTAHRTEVDKLKQMLIASETVDIEFNNLVQTQLSRTVPIPFSHAICMIAAMECGYRPTAEKYLMDLYDAVKPSVERGMLLMNPLIPRWLRNAMVPIFVRDKDIAADVLMTGNIWLRRTGADCHSADSYPVYASYSEPRPPGRITSFMMSDHIEFEANSYLSKFLRALFSGRDGGAFRTLHTYLTYSARTGCVPQGRVVSSIWSEACKSWAKRYGVKLVASIEKVVGVRSLAAIYAGGGGFVGFRNGFCERIISGIFTRDFGLDAAGESLNGSPGIGGSYRIVGEGNLDRRDAEVLATLINAVESRGVEIDLRGVKRAPYLYSSVNFIHEGKRTAVYEMWRRQRIKLSFPP